MSEPQPPPPDWDSIFHRGRRKIVSRILVIGAVATVGALLLFGGGLSAHKTGFLRGPGSGNNAKSDPPPKKQKHPEGKPPQKSDDEGNHGKDHKAHSSDHKQRESNDESDRASNRCEKDSAVSQEYCDTISASGAEPTSG